MPYTHHDENINNYNKVDGSYVLIDIGSTSTPLYKKLSVETNYLEKDVNIFIGDAYAYKWNNLTVKFP